MGFLSSLFSSSSSSSSGSAATASSGKGGKAKDSSFAFSPIPDQFETFEQVQDALHAAGLESSNLILGIDCTRSNTFTGRQSYGGKSLHDVRWTPNYQPNPYEQVISIMGECLEPFDDDNLIPVFGFGDRNTQSHSVFQIGEGPCEGFQEALKEYKRAVPRLELYGPTSFAPLIRKAIEVVKEDRGYHILVIIADGQISAECMRDTVRAIVDASSWPLSIVMVGVGDGPWDTMQKFDDELPERKFDNFQFVNFEDCKDKRPAVFALEALMEVPEQYNAIQKLGLLKKVKKGAAAGA